MATKQSLKAEPRKRTGSGVLKQMRREGWIPSVIYGSGTENQNVKVHAKTFTDMLNNSPSKNFLVELDIEEGKQLAFVQDLQNEALSGAILHADFRAVSDATEISADLPLELEGTAPGVKLGGLLEQLLYTVNVKCAAKDLPATVSADVSKLNVGDTLHIEDLKLPEGVRATLGSDVLIALVAKTRAAQSAGDEEGEAKEAEAEAPAE